MGIKKLFFNKSNTITSAAFLIGGFAFLSRLLGLIRARIFAHQFGAGIQLDMYYAAFRLPDLIYNLIIMGAISSAFIPVFTAYRIKSKNNKKHWELANNALHTLSGIIFIISGALMISAPFFVSIIAPGFNDVQKAITTTLTRIMLIQPLILSISGIISGILQSFKTFFAYALAPCLYNIGIIIGALFFVPYWGIHGLAFGVILGALLHLLIQIPALKNAGYNYRFIIDLKNKGLKKIIRLAAPRSFGLATIQINIMVMTAIASTITKGSISIFNYANNIQYVPLGIVGVAFATAAFPSLSEKFAQNNKEKFADDFEQSIRKVLFLVVPIAVLFFTLRFEIVNVILKTGEFNINDVWLTASCLALFTLGIPLQSLIPLLSRSFYALHNTIKPVLINSTGVLINIVLSFFFVNFIQNNPTFLAPLFHFFHINSLPGKAIIGLPLAYSIGGIFNAIALTLFLKKEIRHLKIQKVILSGVKSVLAGAVLLVTSAIVLKISGPKGSVVKSLLTGTQAGICGLIFYLIAHYLLGGEEVKSFIKEFNQKNAKK